MTDAANGGQTASRNFTHNLHRMVKDTLHPYQCGWKGCRTKLNSIHTLEKHIKLHGKYSKNLNDDDDEDDDQALRVYLCAWKGCASQSFTSKKELHRHISLQHISYLQFPCLLKECKETFTLRHEQAFSGHITHMHPTFQDDYNSRRTWLFRRSAALKQNSERRVEPLPSTSVSTLDLLSTMVCVHQNKNSRPGNSVALSDVLASPPVSQGHKRGRLETGDSTIASTEPDDCSVLLQSLPKKARRMAELETVVISTGMFQQKAEKQLSRPPPVRYDHERGLRKAPDSFGYDHMLRLLNS